MIEKRVSLKLALMSFVAAVLVVCIHAPVTREPGFSMWFEDFFGSKIPSVAVPFFFVASGYFLANRMESQGYSVQLKKRIVTLLIPYLIWCVMLGALENCNSLLANIVNHYPLMRHIETNPIHIFGLDLTRNPPLPLWFLRALMLYVIASPVLLWIARRKYMLLAFAGSLVLFACTKNLYIPQGLSSVFAFTFAPVNILAFTMGLHFSCNPRMVSMSAGKVFLIGGMTSFFSLSIFKILSVPMPYAVGTLMRLCAVGLALAGAWSVCPALELPRLLRGQSFPIYLCHAIFVPYVLLFSQKFPFMLGWGGFVMNVILLVFGSLIVSHLLHRHMPRFCKVIFGGR